MVFVVNTDIFGTQTDKDLSFISHPKIGFSILSLGLGYLIMRRGP